MRPGRYAIAIRKAFLLALLAAANLAGCSLPGQQPPAPTAAEILYRSTLVGAKGLHFTFTATDHVSTTYDGEGDMVLGSKPGFELRVEGVPVFRAVGTQSYLKRPDDANWVRLPEAGHHSGIAILGAGPGSTQALIGQENLAGGHAYHITSTDRSGIPTDLWARTSDFYPLRLLESQGLLEVTLTFDKYNTGVSTTDPAPGDAPTYLELFQALQRKRDVDVFDALSEIHQTCAGQGEPCSLAIFKKAQLAVRTYATDLPKLGLPGTFDSEVKAVLEASSLLDNALGEAPGAITQTDIDKLAADYQVAKTAVGTAEITLTSDLTALYLS